MMMMQQQQQQMAIATPFMNPLAAFGFGGSPFGGLFPGMEMMDPFGGGGGGGGGNIDQTEMMQNVARTLTHTDLH